MIAAQAIPLEGCAMLLGYVDGSKITVSDLLPAENKEYSPSTFHIDPTFIFATYQQAERERKELVAIFHSHPAPPKPSSIDLQYMRLNPVVWLILSTTQDRIEAHQLFDEKMLNVKIVTPKDSS
jgi:proteasome lid subunit RPN8/RPN11